MPQSDVFRPRHRLPLDPFAPAHPAPELHQDYASEKWRYKRWEVDLVRSIPRSGLQQQVILVLGEPASSDILPLLTSSHLSHSLVLIATHDPASLAIPVSLPPGPAVRVLRLAAPLNVHDAGALRLVNFLERAQRVAKLWRHSVLSGKGKGAAAAAGVSASHRVVQLAQDGIDGEFAVVKPFAFAVDQSRKPAFDTRISAQSQSQTKARDETEFSGNTAQRPSSQLYPSPPPSIASASDTSIPATPSPKKAAHTSTSKSRFSILSLSKSPSSSSLRDSHPASPKSKKLHKSSTQLSQLVKDSAQSLEIKEQILLNASHSHDSHLHTRTFDAIVNFLPAGGLSDKALLKCAILVTTLSAQYLALPADSVDADQDEDELEDEHGGPEHDVADASGGYSHSLPAHTRTSPIKNPTGTPPKSTSNTMPTLSTPPPSSFAALSSTTTQQTPTQKPHRYHYQRRSSLLAASAPTTNVPNGALPIPPPMASYPSSSSSVTPEVPQRPFSMMMSVLSETSPSSSSSLSAASRPELLAHTSSDTSRSSWWAQASSTATSSQTTPATSPLPSPGISALSGIPLEVESAVGDHPSNSQEQFKKRKSLKHRLSVIFGGRPEVQWKPKTPTQQHAPEDAQTPQRATSTRGKSITSPTKPKRTTSRVVNAHIVHVLPQGWTSPEDAAFHSSQSRRHSYASTLSSVSASPHNQPLQPRHNRSGSGDSVASTRSVFGKPKLVQGIEQFLLSFAVNVYQPGHAVHSFSSPGSDVKAGKRPVTSSGVVSNRKSGWSDPGSHTASVSVSLSKGQLASLVEAEGKKERELQMKSGIGKTKTGRGPPVPFLVAPGVFGKSLTGARGFGEKGGEGQDGGREIELAIGELILLGGLDSQSAGRAWVDAADIVVLGSPREADEQAPLVQEVVPVPIAAPVPEPAPVSRSDQQESMSSPLTPDDVKAEDKSKVESDEDRQEATTELNLGLLPTPPDSQSSSVRSRSQSHSGNGSGSSSEESAGGSGSDEAEDQLGAEVGNTDETQASPVDIQENKESVLHTVYPAPPERVYSQYAEPPMMITLTSPTVGSPSPPPSHHSHHRRLASNDSASVSTSALPLPDTPPSSWRGPHSDSKLDKGIKVPRAIYVSSGGSISSSIKSRSDSRLPLPKMDMSSLPPNPNPKLELGDHLAGKRKRAKSHDGFGSTLRKFGLGLFGRGGGGGRTADVVGVGKENL